MGEVRVELLGPVRLVAAGQPQRIGGPLPRALLVLLAVARTRSVSDDELIDEVWGELPPPTVEASLRVHIAALRQAVAPHGLSLVRRHHGYAIEGAWQLDTDDLDAAVTGGRTVHTLDVAERVLVAVRGPALTDLRRLPVGARVGPVLDGRVAEVRVRRLELLVEAGRAREALGALEVAVAQDVIDERSWAALALARCQLGDQRQALATVEEARGHLLESLGLDPGPALREAELRILRNDVPSDTARGRSMPVVPPALAALSTTRIAGRDAPLDRVGAALDQCIGSGRSTVVRITGEPGAGKTTFLAHLAARAVSRGITVELFAAAGEGDRQPHDDGSDASRVAAAVPAPVTGDELVARYAARVRTVRETLQAIAAASPAVVLVDDVQWEDAATVAAVRDLARRPATAPLLVVVAERTGSNRVAGRGVEDLALPRLDHDDVALCCSAAGAPPDDATVLAVCSLTGGLAWLVGDAVSQLASGRAIDGLADALAARLMVDRLDILPATDLVTLQWAAVVAPRIDLRVLERVAALDPLEVLEAVDRLAHAHVLTFDDRAAGAVRFDHALLQVAVERTMGVRRVQRMHEAVLRRCGDLLSPTDRLRHALDAGPLVDTDDVARIACAAVHLCLQRDAYGDSLRWGQRALARLDEEAAGSGDGKGVAIELHAALLLSTASAAVAVGEDDAALASLARARVLAAEAGSADGSGRHVALFAAIEIRDLFGRRFLGDDDVLADLLEVQRAVSADSTDRRRPDVLRRLAVEYLHRGDTDRAVPLVAEFASAAQDPLGASQLLLLQRWLADSRADRQERAQVFQQARRMMTDVRSGEPPIVAMRAASVVVTEALHAGDLAEARQAIERMREAAYRARDRHGGWLARAMAFTPPFLDGDLDAADEAADVALAFGREGAIVEARGTHASQRFATAWLRGDVSAYLDIVRALAHPAPDTIVWQGALALAAAMGGHHAEANAALDALVPHAASASTHWLGTVGFVMAAEAAAIEGHRSCAATLSPLLARRSGNHVLLGQGALDYGPVDRYLALVESVAGDEEQGTARMQSVAADAGAGEVWRALARAWCTARTVRAGARLSPAPTERGRP